MKLTIKEYNNFAFGFPIAVMFFCLMWNMIIAQTGITEVRAITIGETILFIVLNGIWFLPLYINKIFQTQYKKEERT